MRLLLLIFFALTVLAQTTGTPVSFSAGTFSGTAANGGTFATIPLKWTPTSYPATITISDGTASITVSKASATSPFFLGQALP
jgi:hypothetical protein